MAARGVSAMYYKNTNGVEVKVNIIDETPILSTQSFSDALYCGELDTYLRSEDTIRPEIGMVQLEWRRTETPILLGRDDTRMDCNNTIQKEWSKVALKARQKNKQI